VIISHKFIFITEDVPSELILLTNLEKLTLRWRLQPPPFSLKTLIHITHLDLGACNLQVIPSDLWRLKKLKTLLRNSNKLSSIPSQIGHLSKISYLDLDSNFITEIPNQIKKLKQLGVLILSNNLLTEFPSFFSSFSELHILSLYKNRLTEFPSQLPHKIFDLDLNRNSITSIPVECLTRLFNIKILNLSFNQITILPIEIGQLSRLQCLELANNQFSFIPSDLVTPKYFFSFSLFKFCSVIDCYKFVVCDQGQLSCFKSLKLTTNNNLSHIPLLQLQVLRECEYTNNTLKFPRQDSMEWEETASVYSDLYSMELIE
jgi:Leucine-rich repeat (LRR) protein